MVRIKDLLTASALVVPFSIAAWTAQAADIAQTLKDRTDFSTLYHVLNQTGLLGELEGDGPYTIFAPNDEAFATLPASIRDQLMQAANKEDLQALLKYHIIEGEEIKAEQAIGSRTTLRTLADDDLGIDGTGEVVLLIPTGMTVIETAAGPIVRQRGMAVAAPAIEVGDPALLHAAPGRDGGQRGEGQQQAQGQGQGEAQGQGQQQAQRQGQDRGQPMGQEQQQARQGSQQGSPQQQRSEDPSRMETAAGGAGSLGDAIVIEPDIQADNGIIHGINSVLIPQQVAGNLDMSGLQQLRQDRGEGGSGASAGGDTDAQRKSQ